MEPEGVDQYADAKDGERVCASSDGALGLVRENEFDRIAGVSQSDDVKISSGQ
jgi:hypothetical protein